MTKRPLPPGEVADLLLEDDGDRVPTDYQCRRCRQRAIQPEGSLLEATALCTDCAARLLGDESAPRAASDGGDDEQ